MPESKPSTEEIRNGTMGDAEDMIQKVKTTGAVSMTPELFEKLYLSPQNTVKGELRKTFGNPTPIALVGFLISLTPLTCDLMGWRGAGGTGASDIAVYFFFGFMMVLGGILEWVLGNTFPCVVFITFGSFYMSFAGTLNPSFAAYALYAPAGKEAAAGLETPAFNASFGFFTLAMGVMSFIFLICALRTNICFVVVFLTLALAFGLLTGAYWLLAQDYVGNAAAATKLIVGGGSSLFATAAVGWWIFLATMLASMDFPFQLPVGDLSTLIPSGTERAKLKNKTGQV